MCMKNTVIWMTLHQVLICVIKDVIVAELLYIEVMRQETRRQLRMRPSVRWPSIVNGADNHEPSWEGGRPKRIAYRFYLVRPG